MPGHLAVGRSLHPLGMNFVDTSNSVTVQVKPVLDLEQAEAQGSLPEADMLVEVSGVVSAGAHALRPVTNAVDRTTTHATVKLKQ